jgi:hypothetical protein
MRKVSKSKEAKPTVKAGTIRIKTADLMPYEKTRSSWKKSAQIFPQVMLTIELFKAHNHFGALIDRKNPEFLKGELSADGKTKGARINILPNGQKLDKAFPLFARHLTIHDESSTRHWDVIYQNPGGTYSYLYTLEKRSKFVKKKYKIVDEFAKCYLKLQRNAYKALKDANDHLAVPMFTLLKTYMRIGNEIYYKAHHHKGLTTLKSSDISIDGNYVSFSYIAKDGVPTTIKSKFPKIYISRLKKILKTTKKTAFIFVNKETGHPFNDSHFKEAFKRYCGKEFYPHIVRSYYATKEVREFLARLKSPTREQMRNLFLSIAEKLGHKRFAKKDGIWKECYNVTVHHYIKPELLKKIKAATDK